MRLSALAVFIMASAVVAPSANAQAPFGTAPHALDNVPPAIVIPLDCIGGILARGLRRRVHELEFTPIAERVPSAAIQLANEWVAMAERCPEEPDHTWTLIYAGYVLELGGEMRSAAEQYRRVQQHARSQSETAASDGGHPLRDLEVDAAMRRARALERLFEFDDALATYHAIIDDPVFAESEQPQLLVLHVDALGGALSLLYRLRERQAFDGLLRRLRRSIDMAPWPSSVEVAQARRERLATWVFFRATFAAESGRTRQALRELERFVAEFGQDTSAAQWRLYARWRIFELRVDSGARSTRAVRVSLLRDVLDAAAGPIPNTIGVRESYSARARFRLTDEPMADLVAHLRASPTMTRAALERGIELADAVATAHGTELTDGSPFWAVRGIARSADAYALLVHALDESMSSSEPAEWQRAARAQLACHAVVLDRLALSHAHLMEMDTEWLVTSINRLALTPHDDILACGEQLPAASGFPVIHLDAPPTAPVGLRLPLGDPVHVIPDLVDVPL